MNHTPEPWVVRVEEGTIAATHFTYGPQGKIVMSDEPYYPQAVTPADQRRITACINALAGLNPDAVAGVVAALEAIVDRTKPAHLAQGMTKAPTVAQIEQAKSALAALRAPRVAQEATQ